VPELVSYGSVEDGHEYGIDLVFTGNEWFPAERIDMPRHHGSRLELVNLAEFPELDAYRSERLHFRILLISRQIREVPDRFSWRAQYFARIVGVCR
jgi:hypothetical protein